MAEAGVCSIFVAGAGAGSEIVAGAVTIIVAGAKRGE